MTELEKRILDEYETFYLDMVRTSKDNLFSHAEEITIKRCIATTIQRWKDTLESEQLCAIQAESNILDAMYRRMSEGVSSEYFGQIINALKHYPSQKI